MKEITISTIIERLERLKEEQGDLPVILTTDNLLKNDIDIDIDYINSIYYCKIS